MRKHNLYGEIPIPEADGTLARGFRILEGITLCGFLWVLLTNLWEPFWEILWEGHYKPLGDRTGGGSIIALTYLAVTFSFAVFASHTLWLMLKEMRRLLHQKVV